MNPIDPVLVTEAARILGVAPETVRQWERNGKLPAVKTGRGVRLFDRRDIEQLVRERAELAQRSPAKNGERSTGAAA